LRSIQPFDYALTVARIGIERIVTPQQDLARDPAHRLDVLWNVDKHRRLLRLGWFYEAVSGVGEALYMTAPRGEGLADGQVIFQHIYPTPADVDEVQPSFVIRPTLLDDPHPYPEDLIKTLNGWLATLAVWAIPRVIGTLGTGIPPAETKPPDEGWPYLVPL
jgi:hypothetical protein